MRAFALLICGGIALIAVGQTAKAEEMVFRFNAQLRSAHGPAPPDSLTAQAAELSTISGTFGFSMDAKRIAEAGIPGRVAFATYATGFIQINELDTSGMPGSVTLRVADGVPQTLDPKTTIQDDLILSYSHVSLDQRIDSLSLQLRYKDADSLNDVAIPSALNFGDFESVSLSFHNRIDQLSNRKQQPTAASGAPVMTSFFEVLTFERVD